MDITHHAGQRMNQRGITKEMIELTIQYGESQGDRTTLSGDALARLVVELQCQAEEGQRKQRKLKRQIEAAKKLLDKGGTTDMSVVPPKKSRKGQGKRNQFGPRNPTEQAFKLHKMNQRGITKERLDPTIQYGESQGERTTLSGDALARLVVELQCQAEEGQREQRKLDRQIKIAKKLLDKGGITVVIVLSTVIPDETMIITTFNVRQKKSRRWQEKKN